MAACIATVWHLCLATFWQHCLVSATLHLVRQSEGRCFIPRYSAATLSLVDDTASGDGYEFSWHPDFSRSALPPGAWVQVRGGDLPFPIELRIHQDTEGRYVVTGLLIGEQFEPREITALSLRRIKLTEILAHLFADFDPDDPPAWTVAAGVALVAEGNASLGRFGKGLPARGPDDETLRAFAHTYRTEQARSPRRAMSAAAEAHGISRATANRWAHLCRQLGYLPGKSSPPQKEE